MKALMSFLFCACFLFLHGQTDANFIRKIYDEALTNQVAYENLRYLCKEIGPRLSGSKEANEAISWGETCLNGMNLDTVWKQEIKVTNWKRYRRAIVSMDINNTKHSIKGMALGGSIGTEGNTINAPIIEVESMDDLDSMSANEIKGKIVFINKPMDPKYIRTFKAYGACFMQRYKGASAIAEKGGVGLWLRSLSLWDDHEPHTGSMKYEDGIDKIPALAIGTSTADSLHELLKQNSIKGNMQLFCGPQADTISYNVIGEIRGREFPNEYIVIGGHLDSWDAGEGAHDDGAGIVQSMEVLRLFKSLNYTPKRSIRIILFMNEENGNAGGIAYAKRAKALNEVHLAGLESDRGGFTPQGFTYESKQNIIYDFSSWVELLKPYQINFIKKGYSGVDIHPLIEQGPLLFGYEPDSQRYFDYHHSDKDVFESVHPRELTLGAAAMTTLIYLIDKYGLSGQSN